MSWIMTTGKTIDCQTAKHLHSEIRKSREFWYNKSIAYLNWYTSLTLALLSAFFLLFTKKDEFGPFLGLLTILPLIAVTLCHYAKKSITICYRQFLEHTAMMAKIDYILGMYATQDSKESNPFFENDNFISPQRYFDYLQKFKHEHQFVAAELNAPERTYNYKLSIFRIIQILAILLALIVGSAGIFAVI